jgi:hypothetical protein
MTNRLTPDEVKAIHWLRSKGVTRATIVRWLGCTLSQYKGVLNGNYLDPSIDKQSMV